MNAILKLTDLYRRGDELFDRLRRARTREDVARLVRSLRRWHHELQDGAKGYSDPLAASLLKMNPRPEEVSRIGNVRFIGESHRLLLVTTATALYRLAPHLANAKPARKTGPKARDLGPQIEEARRLRRQDSPPSKLKAAKMAVKKFGPGNSASDKAAIDLIRHDDGLD